MNWLWKNLGYKLMSVINIIGIGVMLGLAFVSLTTKPTIIYNELSLLTTRIFWIYLAFWCLAMMLNNQSKMDKEYKDDRDLRDMLRKI